MDLGKQGWRNQDGKGFRVGMFSYGSGLAASFFEIEVRALTGFNALGWLEKDLANRTEVSPTVYDQIMTLRAQNYNKCSLTPYIPHEGWLWDDQYVLVKIDHKFRRVYRKINVDNSDLKRKLVTKKEKGSTIMVDAMSRGAYDRIKNISGHMSSNRVVSEISKQDTKPDVFSVKN